MKRAAICLYVLMAAAFATAAESVESVREGKLSWYDARSLSVEGRGWDDTLTFYERLPKRALSIVPKPVWGLSLDSAGLCVRFSTDATAIHARWVLRDGDLAMNHMPATGVSGLDLYVREAGEPWRWLAIGRPTQFPTNTVQMVSGLTHEKREYMLYLPLYNGVWSVNIGVPEEYTLSKAEPRDPARRKPIVFYGTSITQGGCASRPGMVHTAILGRWLDYPVVNLGFSGNGRMEPVMAELLAELDPSVYVLDCLPNMTADQVKARVEPFVQTLRKAHPDTPILLVEDRNYSNARFVAGARNRNAGSQRELKAAYARLTEAKVGHLYYLPADKLLGDDIDNEATVDGSHPTDLGFMRQSHAFREVLEPMLP